MEKIMNYKDFFKDILSEDLLPGGKGDNRPNTDFDPTELSMGITVEMEHCNDAKIAEEISKDHLTEDPHYYTKLKKAGLADELNDINPGSGLGDPDSALNSEKRIGVDNLPNDVDNIKGDIGDTHLINDPKDGSSNLDAIVSVNKIELKNEPVSNNLVSNGETKPFITTSQPIVGKNGGGKLEDTPQFGDCEKRLMSLAGIKVLPVCVIGMSSPSPTTEEPSETEIEVSPESEVELNGENEESDVIDNGITSDMGENRWSIPFNENTQSKPIKAKDALDRIKQINVELKNIMKKHGYKI